MHTIALRTPTAMIAEQAQALDRHLRHCTAARGRWCGAAALAELAHGLIAPRFITTVSVMAVLIAALIAVLSPMHSWWA